MEPGARGRPGAGLPLAVVGAGAAGVVAAIFAARRGARVVLLETKRRPGAKIRVSGGGRCNLLPSRVDLDDFRTVGSIHSLRNVLLSWPLESVRGFFERELGVALRTEPSGKVFPASDDPREVLGALLGECRRLGVELRAAERVSGVRRVAAGEGKPRFELELATGAALRARRVVLATGGLSLARTGSDGFGFEVARRSGHRVEPLHPVLVGLTSADRAWGELAGLSARVRLGAARADSSRRGSGEVLEEREGDLLITHRGFSGPAVLDLSHRFTAPRPEGEPRPELRVAWLGRAGGAAPEATPPDWGAILSAGGRGTLLGALRARLPRRLALRLLARARLDPGRRLAELPRHERERLRAELEEGRLPIDGDEGYATAEATGGGVPLAEVSPKSLESRLVPGLHLAGELLDVHGRIGGYNFLWAWVTGKKAGEGAAGLPG